MFEEKSVLQSVALHLIAILFVVMNVSSIKIVGISSVVPLFDLMIVFYFAVLRNVFSVWFIFLMGIWHDALNGTDLGVTALCYILLVKLFAVLNNKMLIRENFQQLWQQFIGFCFLFLLMKWAILSLLDGVLYSWVTPVLQFILSSVVYVIMHKFFGYLSNKLIEGE